MTIPSKDEILAMAREAGAIIDPRWGIASNIGTATFERFATLCRAPLVAEIEALERVTVSLTDHIAVLQEPVAYIAWKDGKPCYEGDDAICEDAVWPVDSDDDRTSMPVCTAPQPAAQEQTSAVPVVRQMVVALDLAAPYFTHNNQVTAAIAAGQKFIKENGK